LGDLVTHSWTSSKGVTLMLAAALRGPKVTEVIDGAVKLKEQVKGRRKSWLENQRKQVASALQSFALVRVDGKKFETVLKSVAVAHDRTQLHGLGRQGHAKFQSDHLSHLDLTRDGPAQAFHTEHIRSSPEGAAHPSAKNMHQNAHVQLVAGKAPHFS
jgi:hypothetical protein